MSVPQGLCERTVSGEYWGEGSGRRGFGAWKRDSLVAPAPRSAEVFPSTTASDLRSAQQNPFTESRVVQGVDSVLESFSLLGLPGSPRHRERQRPGWGQDPASFCFVLSVPLPAPTA